jgi:uncharacterized protein with ACT and thioredoxin-like domain
MMRFYSLSLDEVMEMPVRAFWKLHEMIDRVRGEEMLDWLPIAGAAMGGDHIQKLVDQLKERIGSTVIVDQMDMPNADRKKLEQMFG